MIVVERHSYALDGCLWIVIIDGRQAGVFRERACAIEYAAKVAGVKLEAEPGR